MGSLLSTPAQPYAHTTVVCLEGIIGAGKSTVMPALASYLQSTGLQTICVPEPVDRWRDMLQLFYSDPQRYGAVFQTYVVTTRARAVL